MKFRNRASLVRCVTTWTFCFLSPLCLACDPTDSAEYLALDAERVGLVAQISALETELKEWKADDRANFMRISRFLNLAVTEEDFSIVPKAIAQFKSEFPKSGLIEDATKLAKKSRRLGRRLKQKREKAEKLKGTPISFEDLYVKAYAGELKRLKRYRVRGCVIPFPNKIWIKKDCQHGKFLDAEFFFDAEAKVTRKIVLGMSEDEMKDVVVSIALGILYVHAVE